MLFEVIGFLLVDPLTTKHEIIYFAYLDVGHAGSGETCRGPESIPLANPADTSL